MWSVVTISDSAVPHYEGLCIKVGGENGISLNNLLSVFRHRVGGLHSCPGSCKFWELLNALHASHLFSRTPLCVAYCSHDYR